MKSKLREGAKSVLAHGVALLQKELALVEDRVALAQETLERPFL